MQIIDSNDFNLRTVAFLLEKGNIEFLIIPVLHVGSIEFYNEVSSELHKCDKIIYEGVGLKKMKSLSRSYKRFAKRLGLVYQNDAINLNIYKAKLIHADFGKIHAEEEWNKIPLVSRLFFSIVYPIGLLILSYFQTQRSFAKSFKDKEEIDDQFWFMKYGKTSTIDSFIKAKRDQIILQQIDNELENHKGPPIRIGILYGAGHMKNVILYLTETHKFYIKNSWFLTVLWLTEQSFRYKRSENFM